VAASPTMIATAHHIHNRIRIAYPLAVGGSKGCTSWPCSIGQGGRFTLDPGPGGSRDSRPQATKTGCLLNGNPAINLEFDPWFSVPVSQRVWLCQKQDNYMTIFLYEYANSAPFCYICQEQKSYSWRAASASTPQASPPPDTFHFHPLQR
jgi:hypothetical protein